MKVRCLILCVQILAGCASKTTINQHDISFWKYGETDQSKITQRFGADSFRNVQYRIQENNYIFIQYELAKVKGLLTFLFKNKKLESVFKNKSYGSQGLSDCVVFPLYEDDDPNKCLSNVTGNLVEKRLPLSFNVNSGKKGENGVEAVGFGVELMTVSVLTGGAPIIIGAVLIPFAVIGAHQDSKTDSAMSTVALGGRLDEYQSLLLALPDGAISTNGDFKSILIPGGLIFKEPQFFIGSYKDEVIWIDPKPSSGCTTIFSIDGCTVGKNRQ
jgi:hypothetical protein